MNDLFPVKNSKMNIELKRLTTGENLQILKDLYISAFPADERREFSELPELLFEDQCFIYKIDTENLGYTGFCICWDFGGFTFIEHFATTAENRGLGIGEKTLSVLKSKHAKTIILETEPPVDEITRRRVNFYMRNGFRMLHRNYVQPSYGSNKPEVDLKLMYWGEEPDSQQLDTMICIIKESVYKVI
jgi:GNAT superfamily N-acetyltransferase